MTDDEHLTGFAKVAGNLLTVEHVLRIFLCEASGETIDYPKPGKPDVALTHISDRRSLGPVITEFNNQLQPNEAKFKIDDSIVKIRDALAHGRLSALTLGFPLTLHKFGVPTGNRVPVEFVEVLDHAWFNQNRQLLQDQIQKILGCARERGYKILKT